MPKNYAQTYASIDADLNIIATDRDVLEDLVVGLVNRDELDISSMPEFAGKRIPAVSLSLQYKAHGAWPADFRHKIEAEAKKIGLDTTEYEVVIKSHTRKERPSECPKLRNGGTCFACEKGKELEAMNLPVPSQFRVTETIPTKASDPLFIGQTFVVSGGQLLAGERWLLTLTSQQDRKSYQVLTV